MEDDIVAELLLEEESTGGLEPHLPHAPRELTLESSTSPSGRARPRCCAANAQHKPLALVLLLATGGVGAMVALSGAHKAEADDGYGMQLWALWPFSGGMGTGTTSTTTTRTGTDTTTTTTTTWTTTTSTTVTHSTTTTTTSTTTTSTTVAPCFPRPLFGFDKQIIKAISYAPVPHLDAGKRIDNDDFMASSMRPFWGRVDGRGRRDLRIMKALGANTVRLYGNDPSKNHTEFLREAESNHLDVIAGFSDYPYTQMFENCLDRDFDCYDIIKKQYVMNLQNGFLAKEKTYHPVLRAIILMNEPDLKFPGDTIHFCRALISAFDAVIDAEKELGVEGVAPNFTVTFSFGHCPQCAHHGNTPALGQMTALREAMRDPASVNYTAHNDLWYYYKGRFMNSVNTANPARDVRAMFLDQYERLFQGTPVFIGEYHSPEFFDQKSDLQEIMQIAHDLSNHMVGITFFEWQVRYDKGGAEKSFGMFGLDAHLVIGQATIAWENFTVNCLSPVEAKSPQQCNGEKDVDYVADSTWGFAIDRIASPTMCCAKCTEFNECKAWTWVEDAGLIGAIKSQCWVKGSQPIRKDRKGGVISGLRDQPSSRKAEVVYVHEALMAAFGGQGVEMDEICPVTTTTTTSTTTGTTRTTTTTEEPQLSPISAWPPNGQPLKCISYEPLPVKTPGHKLPAEDFMSTDAEVFWGKQGFGERTVGRKDLWIMGRLGANAVRLYGADSSVNHTEFLDEARRQGMDVVAGISDGLYMKTPGSCLHTNLNCFEQLKKEYLGMLERGGFLLPSRGGGRRYHPALRMVVLMNQPDTALHGDIVHLFRAVVSAFDGVLQAELEAGVVGPAPNLTVTFSFTACKECAPSGTFPGLGQMLALRGTMREPGLVHYHARNDIWQFYQDRFTNSVNTACDAKDLRGLFLDAYDKHFQGTPVFIAEYHAPSYSDQEADLRTVMGLAEDPSNLLLGISFFEYQVRYDEGCAQQSFGMFGLSDDLAIAAADVGYGALTSWCLTPVEAKFPGQCAHLEKDMVYLSDSAWTKSIGHIPSAEICCTKCKEEPKCRTWTWEADAGLSGCPSQCWLKGGLPTRKIKKDGAVSGMRGDGRIHYMHETLAAVYRGVGINLADVCPTSMKRRLGTGTR